MKTLVFGAGGQLGRELLDALSGRGAAALGATRDATLGDGFRCRGADFMEPDAVVSLLDEIRPGWVINAAAYTAVDRAEREPEAAFAVNATAPGAIAAWCAAHATPLVHYSTDYVFDGARTRPYRPDDPPAPLNVYGASKLAGEEAVRVAGGRHLIFRTAWVHAPHGRNFVRTMLRLGAERDAVRVVADQVGAPTPAAWVAGATVQALGRADAESGTWHLAAAGETSWHGFAEAVFAGAVARGLLARAPAVEAIVSGDRPSPARRPAYSCLDTTTLRRDFGIVLPDWRQGLDEVLDRLAAARD